MHQCIILSKINKQIPGTCSAFFDNGSPRISVALKNSMFSDPQNVLLDL